MYPLAAAVPLTASTSAMVAITMLADGLRIFIAPSRAFHLLSLAPVPWLSV
jgi:hypothetical protein